MNPDPSREDTLSAAADMDATIRMDVRATLPVGMEQPGDMIGRYKLIEPLGEGGFGSVWRAEQSEPIRREVALKVIKPGMDSREIIARFEAERQALALMDHPNIAGVLDAGTTDSGRPFFAMELVKGAPITDYCDTHQLTIRQRLELFIPVCQAVQHAHQKAILHRDLKPSNILVAEVDGKPVPKVIDFGIAKALGTSPEAALQGSLLQTQAGAVIGTPQYMSPEQAGAAPDLDTRSDIYTLGIILYELLTGDTPLSRDSLRKAALDEVLRLVREADPKRPSSRVLPVTDLAKQASTSRQTEPAKLARTLSGDLDWIALKALEKERDRRYGSAAAFAQDLERYLKNEPVEAGPPSPVYRLRKLVRRNRLAFAAVVAIFISLAVGIGLTTWQWQRAEEQKEGQEKLLWTASRSDHEAALNAFVDGQNARGLAHLVRALEYRPMNDAALAASAAHVFANDSVGWRTRLILAFEKPVISVAFSQDDRFLSTADRTGTLRVIEIATGLEISRRRSHKLPRTLSPNGRLFASSDSGNLLILETDSDKEFSRISFGDELDSVSFSPDSRFLVAGIGSFSSKFHEARVIETATGRVVSKTEFSKWGISVGFSPDGRFIAAGSLDKTVRVIEAATGKEISKSEFGEVVNSVSFSPDGLLIAAGSWNDTIGVIEAATGREISKTAFGGRVNSVCFNPDGRFLVAGGVNSQRQGEVRVVEVATGKEISKSEFGESVTSVSFSPDGRYLVTASDDKTVRVFDSALIWSIQELGDGDAMSFSPDSRHLAVGSSFDAPRVIELSTGKEISRSQNVFVNHLSFSPDGGFVAAGCYPNKVCVVEAGTGKEISKIELGDKVNSVSFSPDSRLIVVGTAGQTARVIEAATCREISRSEAATRTPQSHADPDGRVIPLTFSPDGLFIAASNSDHDVRVIAATTGKMISKTGSFSGNVQSGVIFSPDNRLVAYGTDRHLCLNDAASGKAIHSIEFGDRVYSACFSPDGRLIAAGSRDKTVRMFASTTGEEISRTVLGNRVNTVDFSADGRYLSAGTGEPWMNSGGVCLIETASGKQISSGSFNRAVSSVRFSPDGRYLGLGFDNRTVVMDCKWMNPDKEMTSAWAAALRLKAGQQFQPDGRLTFIPIAELLQLQDAVSSFIQSAPTAETNWQHAILKWSQMPPETRTTSPWTTESIRAAVGRWIMKSISAHHATQAPWHPLAPLSLAMTEPKPDHKGWDPVHGPTRRVFLARLTLKRLQAADEALYGLETLAEYAAWAADILHDDLQLDHEALEAIDFALECTPKEKWQPLLKLKEQIQISLFGKN